MNLPFRTAMPRAAVLWMAGLTLAALALRFWALRWGLPLKHAHIDESVVIFYALRVVAGDPNPRVFFDYPSLFLYILAVAFHAAIFTARLLGRVADTADALQSYITGSGALFTVAARAVSAVFGGLSVGLLFAAAWRWAAGVDASGRSRLFAGATAAALLAVNPLHVLHSHYGTVDVGAALFTLLAIHQLVDFWESALPRAGAAAAAAIGLAAAFKYYPGVLVLLLLPAPRAMGWRRPWVGALGLAGAAALGFFVGSPFTLLEPAAFSARFADLFGKIVWSPSRSSAPFWPTLALIGAHAGWGACAAAVWGLAETARKPTTAGKVLMAALALLIAFFGSWNLQSPHYALAVYPLIFLFAAIGLGSLGRLHRALPPAAAAFLVVLALLPTARELKMLSRPDTRLAALDWARANLPAGAKVLRFAHTPEFTKDDPYSVRVDWENKLLASGPRDARDALRQFDFVAYGTYDPARDTFAADVRDDLSPVAAFHEPAPRFPHNPAVTIFRRTPGGGSHG